MARRCGKRRFAGRVWAVACALAAMAATSRSTPAADMDPAIAAHFAQYSLPPPSAGLVIVCHGFGCKYRTDIALDAADHRKLAELLAKGRASPQAEREAVAQAVAWFDRRVGPVAGTTQRVALADFRYLNDGRQFDCIDSSLNTTGWLIVLQELDLLKHHTVAVPVQRGKVLRPPHSTAVLVENIKREPWSVDIWTRNYGQLPEIMPLSRWMEIDIWPWSDPT